MFRRVEVFFILLIGLIPFIVNGQQRQLANAAEGISNAQEIVANAEDWLARINTACDAVEDNNIYKALVDGKAVTFPFGILPDNGDTKYALVVEGIGMDPVKGMTATIMMRIPMSSEESLYFLADEVPLSRDGKLSGDFKLHLLRTTTFSIGDGYDLTIKGLGSGPYDSTYVEFNCRGFQSVTLNGTLDFDPETVETYKEDGSAGNPFSLSFFVSGNRVGDMVLEFHDVSPFQFKSLPGFKCTVPQVILDKSDVKNAPGFKMSPWYTEALAERYENFDADLYLSNIWEGVYIPSIEIEIPKSFSEGSDKDVIVLSAEDFIVDDYGITALIEAVGETQGGEEGSIVEGNLKGFEYQLDTVAISIIASDLSKARFAGGVAFPICDKNEAELYFALCISQSVETGDLEYEGYADFDLAEPLKIKAFGLATASLSGCYFEFKYANNQFFPRADISGDLNVGVKSNSDNASNDKTVGSIVFEFAGLSINSQSPYLSLQTEYSLDGQSFFRMKDGDDSSLGNMPISFDDVTVYTETEADGDRFGLGMTLAVHLQGSGGNSSESSNGFAAEANFTVWAKQTATTRSWSYDGFDLNSIKLEIDNGAFTLKGELHMFENDTVYGDGYCGHLEISIIDKIEIQAATIFGKKVNIETNHKYRYWFVDAMVQFTPGITIATGVELNSFTGGLYHHMTMLKNTDSDVQNCATASGRFFEPNDEIFIGVLAGVGLQSTGGGNAFNGKINFGIEINTSGGINRIATWGGVGFLTTGYSPPSTDEVASSTDDEGPVGEETSEISTTKPVEGSLVAGWYVEYDFPNKTLVGDFDIFIDLAGVVKGMGDEGRAGHISIYSSPAKWYVYIGKPLDRMGVEVINFIEISAYMCFGSELPSPPIAPLPPEIDVDFNIDEDLLNVGGGFAFGARIDIGGDASVGFSALGCGIDVGLEYYVKAGFDILIAQSLRPVYCEGFGKRGIRNWYATGQAFLCGGASLYAEWSCLGCGGSAEILSFAMSAYVFAQLPKPTYMTGGVDIEFRVLGAGFEKSFNLELGDKCETAERDNNVKFIAGISPADSTTQVAVNEKIEVFFFESLEEFQYEIQISDDDPEVYRGVLLGEDEPIGSGLVLSCNGTDIDFEYEFSSDKKKVVLTPTRVLPENSQIDVGVIVQTQIQEGSDWSNVNVRDTMEISFFTRKESETIPAGNILFAYPLPDMENFYKDETRTGYIQIDVIPSRPVRRYGSYQFNVAFFEGENEIARATSVQYNEETGRFDYEIPTMNFETGKTYALKVMKSPVLSNSSDTIVDQDENYRTGAFVYEEVDSVILDYQFSTSDYATFSDKMSYYNTTFSEVFDGIAFAELSNGLETEGFDDAETMGYKKNGVTVADKLIRLGSIESDQQAISNASGNLTLVSSEFASLNEELHRANLECLINSGQCNSGDVRGVTIEQGKYILPLEYHLPGDDRVTSVYNIAIDIDNDITLPQ